jgi:succinate dehydrogenase / fumarate reductase flavoprotein subunit
MYQTFTGEDPYTRPMKIFPATHYSMGGLWVDYETDQTTGGMAKIHPRNHATSVPGLYAAGECDFAYHGANRLGANSLLSASFSGQIAGDAAVAYVKGLGKDNNGLPEDLFDSERERQKGINQSIITSEGGENAFALHRELGDVMRGHVFVERDNAGLDQALEEVRKLKERSKKISLDHRGSWANQSLSWARQVQDMVVLAEGITKGARLRDECRGSHYKAEFELKIPEGKFEGDPEYDEYKAKWKANNDKWLKHTIVTHTPDGPEISYKPVDVSVLPPEKPRDYR